MTQPAYDPQTGERVVQDTVAEQAASVAPDTSSLDQAGPALAGAGAKPAEADYEGLLRQLQDQAASLRELQDRVEASQPKPAEPEPPARATDQVADQSPGWLRVVLGRLEDRIEGLEVHAGLREAPPETES